MSGYIGNIPVPQATQTRQSFTATASQTTFNTAGYSVGYVDVFLNGVKLAPADYTATNGSDIVLAVGAASGDILEIVAYEIFQVVDQDFTGDFTVDGTTFVVDSTNNRVGVGTSSPNNKLTIEGSATLNPYYATYLANSYYDSAWKYAGNGVAWGIGNNFGGVASGTTIAVASSNSSGSGAALTWNPAFNIDSSGNVGIGTGSPQATAEISGGLDNRLRINSTDGTTSNNYGIDFSTAGTVRGGIRYNAGNNYLAFYGFNNAERLRIDASGNVGIGTSSPVTRLDVSGGSIVSSDGNGYALFAPKPSTSVFGTDWDRFEIRVDPSSQVTYLGNTNGGTGLARDLALLAGSGERMRITSSGSVGIGTSSPSFKLSLGGETSQYGSLLYLAETGHATSERAGIQIGGWVVGQDQAGFGTKDFFFYDGNTSQQRMMLDASGNLLVGKTASNGATQGAQLQAAGNVFATASNDYPLYLNRLGSDGQIAQFRKDGTMVGSIGSSGGYTKIISGNGTFGSGLIFNNVAINPVNAAGSVADATVKLGDTTSRFTDLYLSGGVYLGGTGAANKLDDYEEGTWTPTIIGTITDPSVTYNSSTDGGYTKIGNHVSFWFYLKVDSVSSQGSGKVNFGGLPFTQAPNGARSEGHTFNVNYYQSTGLPSGSVPTGYTRNNDNKIYMTISGEGSGTGTYDLSNLTSGFLLYGSGTMNVA